MSDRPSLAALLEAAERRREVSLSKAAELCGAAPATYRSWKRGQIPVEHLEEVAAFVGHPRTYVLAAAGLVPWEEVER